MDAIARNELSNKGFIAHHVHLSAPPPATATPRTFIHETPSRVTGQTRDEARPRATRGPTSRRRGPGDATADTLTAPRGPGGSGCTCSNTAQHHTSHGRPCATCEPCQHDHLQAATTVTADTFRAQLSHSCRLGAADPEPRRHTAVTITAHAASPRVPPALATAVRHLGERLAARPARAAADEPRIARTAPLDGSSVPATRREATR